MLNAKSMFQHTAARRRLGHNKYSKKGIKGVSTHSRPKAAGAVNVFAVILSPCFNTQPPEGGWRCFISSLTDVTLFQHTAARRRLVFAA